MITIIRILVFLVSQFGYCELVKKKVQIKAEWSLFYVNSAQIVALFVAGLLNILTLTICVMLISGMCLFFYYYKKDRFFMKQYLNECFIVFGIALVILYVFLYRKTGFVSDDLYYWAYALRRMFFTNRLPNFKDGILHQTYTMGSTTYLYYMGKIIGRADYLLMFSLNYLKVSCILPLFSYIDKVKNIFAKAILIVGMLVVTNCVLSFNNPIYCLYVDTLLALYGGCAICFVMGEGVEDTNEAKRRIPCVSFIPLSALILVKNTGFFFCIIALIVLIKKSMKYGYSKWVWTWQIIPFAIFFLWKRHCDLVYENPANSMAAASLGYYKSMLTGKTLEEIKQTILFQGKYAFTGITLIAIIIWIGIICIAAAVINKEKVKRCICFFFQMIFLYSSFMVGEVMTFVVAIEGYDYQNVYAAERYKKTIVICIIWFAIRYTFQMIFDVKMNKKLNIMVIRYASMVCIAISAVFLYKWTLGSFATIRDGYVSSREYDLLSEKIAENNIGLYQSVLISIDTSVENTEIWNLYSMYFFGYSYYCVIDKTELSQTDTSVYSYVLEY